MLSTRNVLTFVIAAIVCMAAFAGGVSAATAQCDANFVQQKAATLTVIPNGIDDTLNLQCAIDYGATLGPGVKVQLVSDTYRSAQLFLRGFKGTLSGMGINKTILQNRAELLPIVNPVTWSDALPSPENPGPAFIAVLGDDVVISDLSIRMVGSVVTQDWYWFGSPFNFIDPALLLAGSNASLRAERIEINGKAWTGPDGNMLAAVQFYKYQLFGPRVTSSKLAVVDSLLTGPNEGFFVYDVDNADITISGNTIQLPGQPPGFGINVCGLFNSRLEVSHNNFELPADSNVRTVGIDISPDILGAGVQDSSMLFRNNRFTGLLGVVLESPFSGNIECAMIGNNVRGVTDLGYLFNADTYGCTVVGQTKDTALDLSGAHTFVGLTPAPAAGQDIAPLLQRRNYRLP